MKQSVLVLFLALMLGGCASYKELSPDPPLLPAERGFIELKNGKDNFELSAEKKYYMVFPAPTSDHFKLMLSVSAKSALTSSLTREFDGKDQQRVPIVDETRTYDSLCVYAVDTKSPLFYWVIDSVRQDVQLAMRYRYVPEWRYTFEVRYATYCTTLGTNVVDRATYQGIDRTSNLDTLDVRRNLMALQTRTAKLRALRDDLNALAGVFPANIASSQDTAYKQYVALKEQLYDEVDFQENYARVLNILKIERDTRGDVPGFMAGVSEITENMEHAKEFPVGVAARLRSLVGDRLGEIVPYYTRLLNAKNDPGSIDPEPPVGPLTTLHHQVGKPMPTELTNILEFVGKYNSQNSALQGVRHRLKELDQNLSGTVAMDAPFFSAQAAKVAQTRKLLPDLESSRIFQAVSFPCATRLAQEIGNVSKVVADEQLMYETAGHVAGNLEARAWAATEDGIRQIADGAQFVSIGGLATQRMQIVHHFENALFNQVKLASQQRVDAFAKMHESTYDNVAALYRDSVFMPVYALTYSSNGAAELAARRKQIDDYLNGIKHNSFPENSIRIIYADFIRNVNDNGVLKTRAIVEHGKFYNGTDKQVKGLIDECDPQIAKWIVKPKDYRRLYALPVTNNARGTNDYVFRIGLRIPSEAQFPVFDINFKLPPEVAQKAGSEQWYQEITLNRKPIKNEGRFRITAPVASNGYESQISPVEMDKAGNNVLEVHFKYPGLRVFEISAMAQVPLIRKN